MEKEYSLANYGRVYNPPEWFYNPSYVVNRIYYIVSGTAVYMDNIQLKPGFLYIFKAKPEFRVSQDDRDPVDHVYFDFFTFRGLISTDYVEVDVKKSPMLLNLIEAIKEDFKKGPCPEKIARAYLEILIHYLDEYLISEQDYSEITSSMLEMIHNKPVQELSVNQMALEMNRNVNHIIRCFKKEVGITPHKYIAMMKVNLAIAYRLQGYSQTEIAEKLGFGSLSAFSIFMKNETGKA